MKEIDAAMPLLQSILLTFLDTLTGHLILVSYLLAVTDEQTIRNKLKKLPLLLVSPVVATVMAFWLYRSQVFNTLRYFTGSFAILAMCTVWVMWAWRWDFWRAVSAACMAAILQVATAALAQMLYLLFPSGWRMDLASLAASLLFSIAAAALLKRLRFGAWFRLLLEDRTSPRRTAAILFALEVSMEAFLILQNGVQVQYLGAYYMLGVVLVLVIIGLIVYLAHWFDNSRTLQTQRDIIAQQQLYEQSLEEIRQEVRSFRHDYKNLLAGLSQQAQEGRLDVVCAALSDLDAGFDRRLGEKIQLSTQIGNLRIPPIRSLLLRKLTDMQGKGVEYRLEILYPVEDVSINVWDFVRCLGILVDNAIEAALGAGQPWVEIILLVQDGRLFLRVSNPYTHTIDPGRIWDNGWSTKGPGRGLGLSSYQRLVGNYPNASTCTSWAGGVFVQELTVEGRP